MKILSPNTKLTQNTDLGLSVLLQRSFKVSKQTWLFINLLHYIIDRNFMYTVEVLSFIQVLFVY